MSGGGFRVAHDLEDLPEGENVILTLKDVPLLNEKGELNEDEDDILENRDLAAKERREFLLGNSSKNRANQSIEQKYNEYERGQILSKYDKVEMKKQGFRLDENGQLMDDAKQKLEEIKRKMANPLATSFNNPTYKSHNIVGRDYEELTDEQRNKQKKRFMKRQKKFEKKTKQNLADFLEDELENNDNDQNKNAEVEKEHMENHGNREQQAAIRKRQEMEEQIEDKKKRIDNYERAVQEANEHALKAKRQWEFEDDMEAQLIQQIENQRKKKLEQEKLLKQAEKNSTNDNLEGPENTVLELLKENEEKEREIQSQKADLQNQQDDGKSIQAPKKKLKKNQEYVSEMSLNQEFLKTVDTKKIVDKQHRMEQKQTSSLHETKNGTTSIVQVSLPSERQIGRYKKQEEIDAQLPDMSIELTQEELEKLREENEMLFEKKLGKGLGGTLSLLRERGKLLESNYDYRGRNLDEKPHEERINRIQQQSSDKSNPNEVQLNYRDETGRFMTKKEAWRYQCRIFHGQGPSKKTLERNKKMELQKEVTRQKIVNQDSFYMQQLKNQQKSTLQPYMKIN